MGARGQENFTESSLSIFAIGYREEQVANVKAGYGTLIPDRELPISGILHESDLHHSQDAQMVILVSLMVPNRWDKDEQKVIQCRKTAKNPVLFVKIGEKNS